MTEAAGINGLARLSLLSVKDKKTSVLGCIFGFHWRMLLTNVSSLIILKFRASTPPKVIRQIVT